VDLERLHPAHLLAADVALEHGRPLVAPVHVVVEVALPAEPFLDSI
jgi:hypothetical protein